MQEEKPAGEQPPAEPAPADTLLTDAAEDGAADKSQQAVTADAQQQTVKVDGQAAADNKQPAVKKPVKQLDETLLLAFRYFDRTGGRMHCPCSDSLTAHSFCEQLA